MKKRIVILSGAGMSAESGISTFRDSGGLWEQHDIMEVASPQGWARNKKLVLDFYNKRRAKVRHAEPNEGHKSLVILEDSYDVQIITQNIDNLHEKAGSTQVLHLHGEILKAQSSGNSHFIIDIKEDIKIGDTCPEGFQLRPHVVWFGESVPMMERAVEISSQADIFIIIGTSLAVYPAASLINFVPDSSQKYLIDPNIEDLPFINGLKFIQEKATVGVPSLVEELSKSSIK